MHMPIGTKYCCGVIEIFPEGEFKPIRGYGNMARRMGIHYINMFLGPDNSRGNGGNVPKDGLLKEMNKLISDIKSKPTCIISSAITDPYFDSIPSSLPV